MRARAFAVAAALLAAVGLFVTAGSAAKPDRDGCPEVSVPKFRAWSSQVWGEQRWDRRPRGAPKPTTVRSYRRKLSCAGPGEKRAMKRSWRDDKEAFYEHRGKKLRQAAYLDAVDPPGLATLRAIASCESGGDPTAVSPDGTYRGKYQFDYGTWASVGGSGDPAAAPEREQDIRAAKLYNQRGPSPWPVCGA